MGVFMLDKDIHYFDVTTLLFIKQGMDVTVMFSYEILWISKAFIFLNSTSKEENVVDLEN
jgi:hypothetical protein